MVRIAREVMAYLVYLPAQGWVPMTVQSTLADTLLNTSAWLPVSMFLKSLSISERVG